jgi:hexosaminidase
MDQCCRTYTANPSITTTSAYSPQHEGLALGEHYRRLADRLSYTARRPGYPLNIRLRFPAAVARVLRYKVDLRSRLVEAYHLTDPIQSRAQLRGVIESRLKPLRRAVDELWHLHRNMWLCTNRAFGLEVIEMRYGTLRTRLESLEDRLNRYIESNPSDCPASVRLEELEVPLHRIYSDPVEQLVLEHARVATPSRAMGTG